VAGQLGHDVLAWRRVPTCDEGLGESAKATEPQIEQCFLARSRAPVTSSPDPDAQARGRPAPLLLLLGSWRTVLWQPHIRPTREPLGMPHNPARPPR